MEKKTPERMCIGCRGMFPKKELIRVVRLTDGTFTLDFTGKKNGRGAYLCRKKECLDKCLKAKQLNRAFKCEIPTEVYDKLKEEFDRQS